MRHRNSKRTVISVSRFRDITRCKCFHEIDNGKGIDNTRQIQCDRTHGDRQSNGKHFFENASFGADFLSDYSDCRAIFILITVMQEFTNE